MFFCRSQGTHRLWCSRDGRCCLLSSIIYEIKNGIGDVFGNGTDPFPAHDIDHDDDDDDEEKIYRTQSFQPGGASTLYHPGEQIEMRRLPDEQRELPDTSYDEDIPLLSGFTHDDDKPAMLDRARDLNFRKSTSANLTLLASAKKEMKLKRFHLGQRAVSPTFARKAILAC